MASRNRLLKFQNIASGDMSQASITSSVTNILNADNVGIQLNFTGTPTGTFTVQVSIDHAEDSQGVVTNAGNWIDLNLDPSPLASGAGSNIYLDLNQLSAPWIRVKYTRTSGSGTLNSFISFKMIGG